MSKTFLLLVETDKNNDYEDMKPFIKHFFQERVFDKTLKEIHFLPVFANRSDVAYGIREYEESHCDELIVVCWDKQASEFYHSLGYDEKVLYRDFTPTKFTKPLIWDTWDSIETLLNKVEIIQKVFQENANF